MKAKKAELAESLKTKEDEAVAAGFGEAAIDPAGSTFGANCSEIVALRARTRDDAVVAACKEYNKGRSTGRLDDKASFQETVACAEDTLATALLNAEYRLEFEKRLLSLCQERDVVAPEKLLAKGPGGDCAFPRLLEVASKRGSNSRWFREVLRALPVQLYYVTFEGSLADQSFKYLDPGNSYQKKTEGSDSKSAGLYIGILRSGVLGLAGFSESTRYDASPSVDVCLPDVTGNAFSCKSAALAGPTETRLRALKLEARTLLTPGLGLTLRTIYDIDKAEWEHHILAHFLRHEKLGLNGGVDLQYNSSLAAAQTIDKGYRHLSARIFVGTRFELPGLS